MKNLTDYQKILQVIEAKGIKIQEAEVMCGLGVTTLQKLKTRNEGKGKLHPDNLEKFLRTFHVERDWWETGEGEMFGDQTSSGERIKTMPLDVWIRLEKNFDSFDSNTSMLKTLLERSDNKNSELIAALIDIARGKIQANEIK